MIHGLLSHFLHILLPKQRAGISRLQPFFSKQSPNLAHLPNPLLFSYFPLSFFIKPNHNNTYSHRLKEYPTAHICLCLVIFVLLLTYCDFLFCVLWCVCWIFCCCCCCYHSVCFVLLTCLFYKEDEKEREKGHTFGWGEGKDIGGVGSRKIMIRI